MPDRVDEKHEFETSLTRAGFRHEEFVLHATPVGSALAPSMGGYEVKVTHVPTQTVKAYSGGPGKDWVARFAEDLSGGLFGQPAVPVGQRVPRELIVPSRRR
jgi:hypothetical protein